MALIKENGSRLAVITGAAQGIGFETAKLFVSEGWSVLIADIQPLDAVVEQLTPSGGRVEAMLGDVSDEQAVVSMAARAADIFGRVDAVVNNAGISCIGPAESLSVSEWQRVMDVNLLGPFLMCREFGKLMLAQGYGAVVNVASVAGLLGIAQRAAYNASKHGLVGLTRTLAAEWGPRGVRVNAACPGWVKTPMDDSATAAGHYTDSDIIGRIPMGRFASPRDVAQAILFLADCDRSGFVNGHTLSVDGGWYADGGWDALRKPD